MLCPECKHNTLMPEYAETINPYIDDHPLTRDKREHTRRELRRFRCGHCGAYYFALGGESPEQAYWRIIRDYAKD